MSTTHPPASPAPETVAAGPPAALPGRSGRSVRERVLAGGARIRRVKRIDRAATAVITLGGLFVVASVSFIFLFIFAEALPLFRAAVGRPLGVMSLIATQAAGTPQAPQKPLVLGTDEYQMYLYALLPDARLRFFRMSDGSVARELPLAGIAGATVTAASRSLTGDLVAAGTADGRVAIAQVRFLPRYEEQRLVDLDIELRDGGTMEVDPGKRPVREVSYVEQEGRKAVAAQVSDDEVSLLLTAEDGAGQRHTLRTSGNEAISELRLQRVETLLVATSAGNLQQWELGPELRLAGVSHASGQPITAMEYGLGANSILVGDASGAVSAWFSARLKDDDAHLSLVRAHEFPSQGVAIRAIGPSSRDRSFVTAGADGSLVLRHMTSERSLVSFPATGKAVESVLITPKSDGVLAGQADGNLARYEVRSPHPEFSWRALFGKVWYEGYAAPSYVWQSTGATDDFEAKLSMVPLVFGTIKATAYALLFAVPLAILGALYTSQFVHPDIRGKIKPTVEIMAALPSVVVGFLAGLWLASRVEQSIVPVLLMLVLLPAFGTAGVLIWGRLPRGLARRLKPGMEIALILPLLLLGAFFAMRIGPLVETAAFQGDFKHWLNGALGLVYDQRNSLVVGIAMGFAVIPIIFTISEDSFSSVPSHLTAASLALGATRWQTAVRVVLPTASPGVFSAVMVGFGRAVGETMIVLMATGNTPVLDWSIFNGMRTLSANIAVEIPEAPHGGTLYRVLFMAGGVLFFMTFVVNTAAEVIRQRLRERYRAL
jgi:phosphate transport system permease protein